MYVCVCTVHDSENDIYRTNGQTQLERKFFKENEIINKQTKENATNIPKCECIFNAIKKIVIFI